MSNPALTCSIILNTYNRAAYLRRLLPGLARLKDARFEIVVVNGPSTDETMEVLAQYAGQIKVVQCPVVNLSISRNLGIQAAAGDIVAFIDDDAIPADPDWLRSFLDVFSHDPRRIGGLGGPVLIYDTEKYESRNGYISDYGDTRFDLELDQVAQLDPTRWFRYAPGGNGAYRRQALVEVGGFDEFYGYYLDESDTCTRLARAGYVIDGVPMAAIRHYPARQNRSFEWLIPRWRVIARSDTYYALKNGGDPLFKRALKTIRLAPTKHFFGEIFTRPANNWQRARLFLYWLLGFLQGYWAGLTKARRLGDFTTPPEPFLPFTPPMSVAPLRISLVCQKIPGQEGYGGIGRYIYDAALGLFARGHEIHLFVKDDQVLRREGLGFFIHGISSAVIDRSHLDPSKPILSKNLNHALAVLYRLEELHSEGVVFDVVHAANWDAEASALIRANVYPMTLMLVTPLAKTIESEGWEVNEDLKACMALDQWQIRSAHTVCVPSEGVKASYISSVGIDKALLDRAQLVGLGIIPSAAAAVRTATAPATRKKLLFVGRLERRKGAHILLSVLEPLLASRHDWECHLVGVEGQKQPDGMTLKESFVRQHSAKPWFPRVTFHGLAHDRDLMSHYQSCDLFVAPSLFESFGLIYQEAMQFGIPVVGTQTGGVPEVVQDGVEGILAEPGNADSLAQALAGLMDNPELRQRMGAAGRRRILTVSNYQAMAARLEEVMRETIQHKQAETSASRHRLWPKSFDLFGSDSNLTLIGSWKKHQHDGHFYLVGQTGARIQLSIPSGHLLRCRTLRHAWSGALEIAIPDCEPRIVDLYAAPDQVDRLFEFQVTSGAQDSQARVVTLQVLDERNPSSGGDEVWVASLSLIEA